MNLKTYLERIEESPLLFAKKHAINYRKLYRLLSGKPPTIKTADQIIRATSGVVGLSDLYPDVGRSKGEA